jgi:hypothetical protein
MPGTCLQLIVGTMLRGGVGKMLAKGFNPSGDCVIEHDALTADEFNLLVRPE